MKRTFLDRLEQLESGSPRPAPDLLAKTFPEQRAFIEDKANLKYAFCTRRAAKSYSGGLYAFREAFRWPKSSVLIIGFVRADVKKNWWDPILKDIDRNYSIGAKFNETELTVRLPNGSMIYVLGLDANEHQRRNALGGKYPLVLIDEAQDFRYDLRKLVYDVLKPAVTDYRGTICLLGTPSAMTSGLFFDITTGKQVGWKGFEWTTYANPYTSKQWKEEIEELKATHPGIENTPGFRRNYLKEWVIDDSELVYRYKPGLNDFDILPEYPRGQWHRVLGIDLGYNDPSAFSLMAYHDHDQVLYVEYVHKQKGMDITAVATQIHWFRHRYDIDHLVIDGANKQAVEEMRKRHQLPLIATDKTGKADFIELMNSELLTGRIKLQAKACAPLTREYENLIWDLKRDGDRIVKRQEHAACDNHACDATLYGWRWTYQYLSEQPKALPAAGTSDWYDHQMAEIERAEEDTLEQEHRARIEEEQWLS